ncbi:hypothetical protein CISIN_1g022962mg [Citrus sinensis]|uniref:Ribosomal RNA small subunit methyltransferase G n=1 Tax=Citrus sinensis TaxID=2711 RepID=A0A067G2V0_CITSI|nr:hypothetical protein CISIN_1g022962mg [Citrus sinensis]
MLTWRCGVSVPIVFHLPFSARTLIKHLPSSNQNTFCPHRTRAKTLTTTRIVNSSHFETLNTRQQEQIHLYVDALLQWNRKMNLTAVKDVNEVMERHIDDSLAIIPPIKNSYTSHCDSSCNSNLKLVDVGTGAGLPGLVLAIACPDWKVTLLESMNKRCVFLEHAVSLTQLLNVQIVRGRAETLGKDVSFREQYDVAVARAVAEMRILAEYCLPLVRVGGLFVAAKGHDPQEEVKNSERAVQLMGASLLQLCSVESQSPFGQRTAVVCLKSRRTPKKYPRDPGTPAKVPL